MHLGATASGFAVAMAVVDKLTARKSRRDAVRGFMRLAAPSITDFHNSLVLEKRKLVSNAQWTSIHERFQKSKGETDSLEPVERTLIYQLFATNKEAFLQLFARLDADLRELAAVVGWSFDAKLLGMSFEARHAMATLLRTELDGSDAAVREVCRHLLMLSMSANAIYVMLHRHAGVPLDDVVESAG
ncbi:hypothetical protein PHYC_02075 [Phycisphaerales bacterium]|nr:hypothetical protein PHYC_02075 [Phycisphaerales bacterium]